MSARRRRARGLKPLGSSDSVFGISSYGGGAPGPSVAFELGISRESFVYFDVAQHGLRMPAAESVDVDSLHPIVQPL